MLRTAEGTRAAHTEHPVAITEDGRWYSRVLTAPPEVVRVASGAEPVGFDHVAALGKSRASDSGSWVSLLKVTALLSSSRHHRTICGSRGDHGRWPLAVGVVGQEVLPPLVRTACPEPRTRSKLQWASSSAAA